jgi:hypothetical protein
MTAVVGQGSVPNPPDTGLVKGLFFERFGQADQSAIAARIAPLTGMDADEGSYAIERPQMIGVRLADDPNQLDPVALGASNYHDNQIGLDSKTFALERYQLGKFVLEDRKAAKLRRTNGIDIESLLAKHYRTRAESLHTHMAFSALTTSANYASGHTYDPGNLSTASFDLITAANTLDARLRDSGCDMTAPLICAGSPASIAYLQKLDQIKNHPGVANPNFVFTDAVLSQVLSDIFGREVEVMRLKHRYQLANGSFGYSAVANTLAFVTAAGGMEQSLLKTLYVDGDTSSTPLLDYRQQRDEAIPGFECFGDAYFQLHVADNTAGVLWTGINT